MEWKEDTLGDLCEISSSKRIFAKEYQSDGVPFYRGKEIIAKQKGNAISNELFISRNRYEEIKARYGVPQQRELLLTSVGTLGVPYVIKEEEFYFKDGNLTWFRHFNGLDVEYLYYWFLSPYGKNEINTKAIGSTQKALTIDSLSKFDIKIPVNLEDQRRIASILSSLDRKIELNNKINADLEEMAQAIFKNWFVDFEPFKDGKFVDSELGMIPEGWKVGTLGELCNFKRGKNLLTKNAIDEGVPVVAGGLEPSCYHNVANTGAPVITVSGSGANAGFMRMYHVPVWASDCSFIDISCENFYFVYCFLKVNSKLLKHAQTGAVQPHVKPSDIHDFELVIPDKESIYEFQDKVKPFFDKIAAIQKENSRLSLLRDTLLPRLMSGEIEVPE
ncbi:restriction endonuclease subunit S [Prevotella sp. P4-119]|uniref:restriction endonuclease subunit S n=1 Tax=Prevotella sp. P4-119 TaxID=2024218 RepID=UPI000B96EF2B|nr:restriction endonuclease subunit S [Prevotella sp. P4-119]OYP44925.1 hypothetical protein CIK89_04250 [Prevotella sp. P4-119]